ncbi:MAG TPA: YihY family inner membrane protein [Burkholderiales bacterium]|nr:YihY family inner membrane protein [Burkholderiales bacterium]
MEKNTWRGFADFCLAVFWRFYEERALQTAGSLTYTTLLSLVPLITVALAVATAFPVFDETIGALQLFLLENFLPDAQGIDTIADQITAFTSNAGRLTAIGLVFFFVTAVMLMMTIDTSLNRLFRVQRSRPMLQQVLMYWAVITLGPVLIGLSLSMTSFAVGASFGWLRLSIVADAVLRVLPFLFTCAALSLLYAIVPNRHVRARDALIGGVIAGIAFELAKRGFAVYLTRFPTYTLIYGAFATIPIFLVWLYMSWVVVLAGATLTAMLPAYRYAEGKPIPGRDFVDALLVLSVLARAQVEGGPVRLREISNQLRLMPHRCEAVLERAARRGWTVRTDKDGWVLARDADLLPVAQIYQAFAFDAETWGVAESDFALTLRQYSNKEKS